MKLFLSGVKTLVVLVAIGLMLNAGDAYANKEKLQKEMANQTLKCFKKFKKDEKGCIELEKTKSKEAAEKCFNAAYKFWDKCLDPKAIENNAKAAFAGKLLDKREKEQDKCTKDGADCAEACLGKKSEKKKIKCAGKCKKTAQDCLKKIDKKYKKKIKKLKIES